MTDDISGFPLMVHVPADEWAYLRRRVTYLEAVLVQVLHDRGRVQEWYGAAEIAAMRLPGLPGTKAGITMHATRAGWVRRQRAVRGGTRFEYHFASLPARAFDSLIGRILDVPLPGGDQDDDAAELAFPEIEPGPAPEPELENTAPPWVLPFMRLLRGGAAGDITAAWRALPSHLPPGVELPTQEEAAETIVRLGLVRT